MLLSEVLRYMSEEFYGSDGIRVEICEKSRACYDFISGYFNRFMSYEKFYHNMDDYVCCVYDGDDIVGVRIFSIKAGVCLLRYTAVDSSYRGMNLNAKMMEKIGEYVLKRGDVYEFRSNVRETNIPSFTSLLKSGFVLDDSVGYTRYYKNGEKKLSMVRKI